MEVVGEEAVVMATPLGPLTKLQEPAPLVIVLPAIVADPGLVQMLWVGPAFAVVGLALTVSTISLVELVHGELAIVQRNV